MTRKYLLPILAILGALFGLVVVYATQRKEAVPPIMFPPSTSPFESSIAGAGIIEASSQNISIGTPFNEIIDKIFVIEGDVVKAGDPLFQLDLRNFNAELESAKASLEVAKATFQDRQKQLSFYKRVKETKAVSEQLYAQAEFAALEADQSVKLAEANVKIAETNIERSIVKAPIDGEILQVNIHVGEIAPIIPFISSQSTWLTAANGTLILMGQVNPLQVRIDIDENDAWRFRRGTKAVAFIRGNTNYRFPLTFVRLEPYIIPKTSFTGETVERVDTRVLQVLYQFEKNELPVYAGQVLDIFLEAPPIHFLPQAVQ